MENTITIAGAAGSLIGAGLTQVTTNVYLALGLVTYGVALFILVAVLNKNGIPVAAVDQDEQG